MSESIPHGRDSPGPDRLAVLLRRRPLHKASYIVLDLVHDRPLKDDGNHGARLYLVAAGRGRLHMPARGTTLELGCGDLLLIPKGCPHEVTSIPSIYEPLKQPTGPASGTSARLLAGRFDRAVEEVVSGASVLPAVVLKKGRDAEEPLVALILRLLAEIERPSTTSLQELANLGDTAFTLLIKQEMSLRSNRKLPGGIASDPK